MQATKGGIDLLFADRRGCVFSAVDRGEQVDYLVILPDAIAAHLDAAIAVVTAPAVLDLAGFLQALEHDAGERVGQ